MANKVPSEREIFTKNYSNFCGILKNEDSLLPYLVDKHIITFDDIDEIKSKPAGEKGTTLLKHISGPLEAGHTNGFYQLLEIMETHGKPDTKRFSKEIRKECPPHNNNSAVSDGTKLKLKNATETSSFQHNQQQNGGGVLLDMNNHKHHEMIITLAEYLEGDGVDYRKLYRFFQLTEAEKSKIDDSETGRMYETLSQYVETKKPTTSALIENLHKCKVTQEYIEFVANYKY